MDARFESIGHPQLESLKALRVEKVVYEKQRTVIVTFNQNLYNDQLKTLYNDLERCQGKLSELSRRLTDRVEGLVTRGKKPTKTSVEKNVKEILKRQYMKQLIKFAKQCIDDTLLSVNGALISMDAELESSVTEQMSGDQELMSVRQVLLTSEYRRKSVVLTQQAIHDIHETFNPDQLSVVKALKPVTETLKPFIDALKPSARL